MERGQYMIDEDCSNNSHHEHAQTTTKLVSEEIVDEVVSEISLEDWSVPKSAYLDPLIYIR